MRKLLIIPILFITYSVCGQAVNLSAIDTIYYNGGGANRLNDVYYKSTWAIKMANEYLSINDHYSDAYANNVKEFIVNTFDTSSYYLPTFRDSTTAGWFHVFQTSGNLTTRSTSKSGDALNWYVEGTHYVQDNIPTHTLIGDSAFIIMATTDGWSGLTSISIDQNNISNAIPKITAPNLTGLSMQTNTINSIPVFDFPSINFLTARTNAIVGSVEIETSTPIQVEFYNSTLIDSIVAPEKWISTDLLTAYFHGNALETDDVDNFYDKLSRYFAANTPIKNLSAWTYQGTNEPPTCGSNNPDLLRLASIYSSAGFTFSALITAGGTGSLQVPTYMAMPDTVYILVGELFEIYDDAIAGMNINDKNINIEYTCDIGLDTFYGYRFNEVVGDVGFYDFKAVAKVCDTKVDSVECVIRLLEGGNGTGTKTFNVIGNSLTANSGAYYVPLLRTGLTGITATMYGTRGTAPNKHEGVSGYRVYDFITGYRLTLPTPGRNPLWNGTEYSYADYRADTLGLASPLDFVVIQLGINDVAPASVDTAWIDATLIGQFETLVDSIVADGTGHVIIAMPPKSENTGLGWINNYGNDDNLNPYLHKMQYLWDTICGNFSGGRYAPNVHVSPQGMFVDRDHGYPKTGLYHNNGVHPDASGYTQLSNALRAMIEGILKEDSE